MSTYDFHLNWPDTLQELRRPLSITYPVNGAETAVRHLLGCCSPFSTVCPMRNQAVSNVAILDGAAGVVGAHCYYHNYFITVKHNRTCTEDRSKSFLTLLPDYSTAPILNTQYSISAYFVTYPFV
jgi:hypothetical protein